MDDSVGLATEHVANLQAHALPLSQRRAWSTLRLSLGSLFKLRVVGLCRGLGAAAGMNVTFFGIALGPSCDYVESQGIPLLGRLQQPTLARICYLPSLHERRTESDGTVRLEPIKVKHVEG